MHLPFGAVAATATPVTDGARQNTHIEKDAQDATLVGLGIKVDGAGTIYHMLHNV